MFISTDTYYQSPLFNTGRNFKGIIVIRLTPKYSTTFPADAFIYSESSYLRQLNTAYLESIYPESPLQLVAKYQQLQKTTL